MGSWQLKPSRFIDRSANPLRKGTDSRVYSGAFGPAASKAPTDNANLHGLARMAMTNQWSPTVALAGIDETLAGTYLGGCIHRDTGIGFFPPVLADKTPDLRLA